MTSPIFPGPGPGLPPGLPSGVIQNLVDRLITPPVPVAAPGLQPGGPVGPEPMPMPGGPPQAPQGTGGPPQAQTAPDGPPRTPTGAPTPEQAQQGLDDDQAEAMKQLMADPKARAQIQKIARAVSTESRGSSALEIDPTRRLQLAQGWNARRGELGLQMNAARGQNPGAAVASDETLLGIYYMTPIAPWAPPEAPFPIPLEDIDEYADAVRVALVRTGWTSIDKIEDQVTRECFPLREPLIVSGRTPEQRVAFVDQMLALTDRWLDRYGELPQPDLAVLKATKEGKGDPESQARDTDSSAYPPGGYRTPPKPPKGASEGKKHSGRFGS